MMKKLAVIGTSRLEPDEAEKIEKYLKSIVIIHSPEVIISGGARGVDSIAEITALEKNIPFLKHSPIKKTWKYYKERNLRIINDCTDLICFTTRKIKTKQCYHHKGGEPHQVTGGCWTMFRALEHGKAIYFVLI